MLEHGGGSSNDLTTQKRGCTYETRAVGAHTQWGGGIEDEVNNNNNTRLSPCNDGLQKQIQNCMRNHQGRVNPLLPWQVLEVHNGYGRILFAKHNYGGVLAFKNISKELVHMSQQPKERTH